MVSHVKSKSGSVSGSVGEGSGELDPVVDPPVWDTVPDLNAPQGTTYEIDMNIWVNGRELTGWALSGNPAGVTINNFGIVTIQNTVPEQVLVMTCYVENPIGNATSNTFNWTLDELILPDAPEWGTVPNRNIELDDLPYQEDMNDHITAGEDLEGWLLSGNPAEITINNAGIVTAAGGTPVGDYLMTCFVENPYGDDTSNSFTWSVIPVPPPVWDDIPQQSEDDADHPVDLDMTQFVTTTTPLINWTTDVGSIDANGLLTIPFLGDRGLYSITVGVTNDGGTEETTFDWLIVGTMTSDYITVQPVDSIVDEPDGTEFTIVVDHPAVPVIFRYFWSAIDGDGAVFDPAAVLSNGGDREDQDYQVISTTAADDGWDFRCLVRPYPIDNGNPGGNPLQNSTQVSLTVNSLAGPPEWDAIPNQNTIFDTFELDVSTFVTADPPVTGYTTNLGSITNAGLLTIPYQDIDPEEDFIVNLTTTNSEGTAGTSFNLIVGVPEPAVITIQPTDQTVTEPDGTAYFIQGTHPHGVRNTWYASNKGGGGWSHASNRLSDVDGVFNSLELLVNSTNQSDDNRFIRGHLRPASTSDNQGYVTISNEVELNVDQAPPVITSQPQNESVVEGESASFSVTATHPTDAPLFYLWTHDFANISGGIFNSTLTVNPTVLSDDGKSATCEVYAYSGGTGPSVVSNPATLSVDAGGTAPEWDTVPEWEPHGAFLPETRNMNDYVDGENITSFTRVSGFPASWLNTNTGIITVPTNADQEEITEWLSVVSATNEFGTTFSNEWLLDITVREPATYTLQPVDNTGSVGSQIQFTQLAERDDEFTVAHSWEARTSSSGNWQNPGNVFADWSTGGSSTTGNLNNALLSEDGYQIRGYANTGGGGSWGTAYRAHSNIVTVSVVEEPVWSEIPDTTVLDDDLPATADITVFCDNPESVDVWGLIGNPAQITINPNTGLVSISAAISLGDYDMNATAENAAGDVGTSNQFTLTVTDDVGDPPVWDLEFPGLNTIWIKEFGGTDLPVSVDMKDYVFSTTPLHTWVYVDIDLGGSVDQNGIMTFTNSPGDEGIYSAAMQVSNSAGASEGSLIVVEWDPVVVFADDFLGIPDLPVTTSPDWVAPIVGAATNDVPLYVELFGTGRLKTSGGEDFSAAGMNRNLSNLETLVTRTQLAAGGTNEHITGAYICPGNNHDLNNEFMFVGVLPGLGSFIMAFPDGLTGSSQTLATAIYLGATNSATGIMTVDFNAETIRCQTSGGSNSETRDYSAFVDLSGDVSVGILSWAGASNAGRNVFTSFSSSST